MDFNDLNDLNDKNWRKPYRAPAEAKTGRFVSLSALIHMGLAFAVTLASVPVIHEAKTETIEIEVPGSAAPVVATAATPRAPAPEKIATVKAEALPEKTVTPAPVAVPVAKVQEVVTKKSTPAPAPKAKAVHVAKARVAVPHAVKAAAPAAPKLATIDDIDSPEVDVDKDVQHALIPTAYNENLDEDLSKVDKEQAHKLAEEKSQLEKDAAAVDAENEKALKNLDAENKKQAAALAAVNEARRDQEQKAIAQARAEESAAAEAAAAARANEAQRQRAAAIAAAEATAANAGPGGTPQGIRDLKDLRQMPGNPIPRYSAQERLHNQQGKVAYYAYVQKDGRLTSFRQIATTGHSNLDSKTLQALQQWKFYPGQEGWVELPFQWNLEGETQSVDGLLRTKSSDLTTRQ